MCPLGAALLTFCHGIFFYFFFHLSQMLAKSCTQATTTGLWCSHVKVIRMCPHTVPVRRRVVLFCSPLSCSRAGLSMQNDWSVYVYIQESSSVCSKNPSAPVTHAALVNLQMLTLLLLLQTLVLSQSHARFSLKSSTTAWLSPSSSSFTPVN